MSTYQASAVRIEYRAVFDFQLRESDEHLAQHHHLLKGYYTPRQDGVVVLVRTCCKEK